MASSSSSPARPVSTVSVQGAMRGPLRLTTATPTAFRPGARTLLGGYPSIALNDALALDAAQDAFPENAVYTTKCLPPTTR